MLFFLPIDVQGELKGVWVVALNFVHPLRAALRLHASPSLGEGEVGLPPLRFAKGDALSVAMRRGMHEI